MAEQHAHMGYRELLKKYIRHLELCTGDNYIEFGSREPVLSKRDIGELRTLAAEIARDAISGGDVMRVDNYNYRLRVLMNRYALTVSEAATFAAVEPDLVRRWRTAPKSSQYVAMSESAFSRFEGALTLWLESESKANVESQVDPGTDA